MPTTNKTTEITIAFTKYSKNNDKSFIENFTLDELEIADTDLGSLDINSPYRLAIQKRIKELTQEKKDKQNEKMHRQNLLLTSIAILISIILAILGWYYFK